MNPIFNKQLHKYLLVFFDDLIYSRTWEEHLKHLDEVLRIMEQSLFAKKSKCEFGIIEIWYLRHVVSKYGVQVHQEKIQAILDWPPPKSLTDLRGFFALCSYYRRFVKGFSQLSAPLTDMTRKGSIQWNEKAQITFDKLKEAMSTYPVLALLDLTRPFILECDASIEGISAVLMQDRHPIAYERRKLTQTERLYSIYDKEILVIVHALTKFQQYLVGVKFVVHMNHNSLRYFLEQRDLNERQQKWVRKVQGFDFDIEYVKGKNKVVADALSSKPAICSLNQVSTDWKAYLLVEYSKNTFSYELMNGNTQDDRYKVVDDIIYYKSWIFLASEFKLKQKILKDVHDSPLVGHPGFLKIYKSLRERFSWKGLKGDLLQYVRECAVYQQNKSEHTLPVELLQPLPIPEHKWESISMDFIMGLPKVNEKDCIFVVIDRLTKYTHSPAPSIAFA